MVNAVLLSRSCKAIVNNTFDPIQFESVFFSTENFLPQETYCNIISHIDAEQRIILLDRLLGTVNRSRAYCEKFSKFANLAIKRIIEAILIDEMNGKNPALRLSALPCTSLYFQFCTVNGIKPVGILTLFKLVSQIEERFRAAMVNADIDSYLAYLSCGISMAERPTNRERLSVSYFSSLVKLSGQAQNDSVAYSRYQEMINAYIAKEGIMPILKQHFIILEHVSFDRRELWRHFLTVKITRDEIKEIYTKHNYTTKDIKQFKNWLLKLMTAQPGLCVELKLMEMRGQETQMRCFLQTGMSSGKVKATKSDKAYLELLNTTALSQQKMFEILRSEDAVQTPLFYQDLMKHLKNLRLRDAELQDFLSKFKTNAHDGVTQPGIIANPAALLCYLLVAKHPREDHQSKHFHNFINAVKKHLLYLEPNEYQRNQLLLLMRSLSKDERKAMKAMLQKMIETYQDHFMSGVRSGLREGYQASAFIQLMRMGRKSQKDHPSKSFVKLLELVDKVTAAEVAPKSKPKTNSRRSSTGTGGAGLFDRPRYTAFTASPTASPETTPPNSKRMDAKF